MMIEFNLTELNIHPLELFCLMVGRLNVKRPKAVKWNDSLTVDGGIKFIFSVPPINWKPGCFQQMVSINVYTNCTEDDLCVMNNTEVKCVTMPTYGMYGQNEFYDLIEDVINEIIDENKLSNQLFGEINVN